jgi:hypothetical protein
MMKFQRFADLKASGLVGNWAQLRNLIRDHNFPPGRMLSPNVRAWSDAEIDHWLASRPQAGPGSAPPLRGRAKARVEQDQQGLRFSRPRRAEPPRKSPPPGGKRRFTYLWTSQNVA